MGKQTGPRFTMAEMLAIFKAQSEGKSLDAASQEILGARVSDNKIDRALLQTTANERLAQHPDNIEAEKLLDGWYAEEAKRVKLYAKIEALQTNAKIEVRKTFSAEENAIMQDGSGTVTATPENGKKSAQVERASFKVAARKEIVHPDGWERPSGVALDAKFDQTKLTARQSAWVKAIIAGGTGKDNLYHNAQYKAAYLTAFGEERNTNFDLVGELPCMVKVYSAKEKAA